MKQNMETMMENPIAYIDDKGTIVIVTFEAWNKASFVREGGAIPDSWIELIKREAIDNES